MLTCHTVSGLGGCRDIFPLCKVVTNGVTRENRKPGQLVLVGDAEDLSYRGDYRLDRIERLHPQIRNGKELVRRATVAVLGKGSSGSDVEYVLRDLSKIAPV